MNIIMRFSSAVLFAFVLCFGYATIASAQTIDVTFESDPLFASSTSGPLMPGDTITRWFTVTNNGSETETVYVRTLNDTDTNSLADALLVSISDVSGEVYGNQLSDLFSRDAKSDSPPIGDLAPGESRTYDFDVTFAPQGGNTYQNGTAAFDFCVGFDGGNENCIIGTGDPDDDDDDDGGGGGGDNPDDDDDSPPGQIAGASTSTGPFQLAQDFVRPIADFVRGMVLGESTSTEDDTATSSETSVQNSIGEPNRTSSPTAIFIDETYCTFWWLLLLGLMLLAWSAYEDRYRHDGAVFRNLFLRNAVFVGGYAVLLFLFQILGALETFWWLFGIAFIVAMLIDYRAHEVLLSPKHIGERNLFFAGTGTFFIVTSFFFGFPCEWWPFMLVALASGLLYLFDENS